MSNYQLSNLTLDTLLKSRTIELSSNGSYFFLIIPFENSETVKFYSEEGLCYSLITSSITSGRSTATMLETRYSCQDGSIVA